MNLISQIKNLHLRLSDPKLASYQKERNLLETAPFSLSLYRRRLETFQEMGLGFPNFNDTPKTNQAKIYVRHDVDTQACIDNILAVTKIDKSLGVPSSVYFRVDDEDYKFSNYKHIVKAVLSDEFEVGLHTSCYSYDDPIERFIYETKKFEDESGIKPTSFTLHGLGHDHHASRIKFRNYAGRNLEKFDYEFSDCLRKLRHYRYVIEDCHKCAANGERFIYDDFISIPDTFTVKGNILVLTHPCYWVP